MGVPKFYRWISERYPCLSEVIKEHQVPEFDNLYLDMNGIIHTCSHPNDNDPHFRITEEKIFQDILHYIEVLFRIIKPKRTFFMAVDGVAPRAKMNQQRGRRFRSAKEAEAGIQEAIRKGETLPSEKRFDSNCITPGTAFMERLQTQLEYFVKTKITHDRMWQGINVYLSGHETPGEGEHKVMEYIRYERSQPGYDPNIRHCLYGLDADLLMLALCTHEPHFSLLREEVKFTQKKGNSRTARAEETTFHLLHISLLREYIDHEFGALKTTLPFKYDLESVIDDWVLMGFLVGNDFIPHLPDLHIATSALPFLYQTYMRVMPTLGGYLNENGVINQTRFQSFLDGIASFDYDHFEEAYDDYKWLASKSKERKAASKAQEGVEHGASNFHKTEAKSIQIVKGASYKINSGLPQEHLAVQQGIMTPSEGSESLDEVESEDGDTFMQEFKLHKKSYYEEKFKITNEASCWCGICFVVIHTTSCAQITQDTDQSRVGYRGTHSLANFLGQYTKEAVSRIAFEYILGLQWICHYYYNGVQSWSWYYPYHYSPYMSDLKNVASMKLKFKMNKPFLPFQQLLAVLPAASNDCIPEAYWYLMDENASPIGDFYPTKFSTDLNGKQQDWEAVVLIPFIDENRLLNAMDPCKSKLTAAESKRNRHGPCQLYTYDPNSPYLLKSTLSGIFPDVDACCASKELIPLHLWIKKDYHTFVKGLLPGCHLSVYYQGFPTLYHLQHKAFLKKAGVKVFQSMSRGENMILKISSGNDSDTSREGFAAAEHPDESLESVSQRLLGKSVYINWPHMEEAKVVAVSDSKVKYQMCEQVSGSRGSKHKLVRKELDGRECEEFFGQVHDIHEKCKFRRGIDVGSTRVLVYAQVLQGHKYICGKKGEITLEKQWSGVPTAYPLQATVQGISVQHPSFQRLETIGDLFPENAEVFNLGLPHYGCVGKVIQAQGGNTTVKFQVPAEPDFGTIAGKMQKLSLYHPGWKVASMVGISSYLLSRITGSIYVFYPVTQRWNVGLNLRFSKENAGIAGFTKKQNNQWLYSDAVAELLQQYLKKFPEVIDYLATALEQKSESEFDAEKMFKSDNVTEKLQELAKWLKSLPSYDGQRVNENSNALEPSVVKLIDETVANFKANNTEPPTEVMVGVRPHFLYRPLTQQGTLIPDKNAQHQLLDRVVNVRDGYTVPLRFRGTIIGVHDERSKDKEVMFDVLFDDEFLGGLTLGGRCPQRKGYKLPACAIINLSHGDRLANKGNKPMAVVRPHHHASTPRGGRDIPKGPNIKQSHFVQSPHSAFRPTQKPSSAPSARNTQPVTLLQRSSPSSPSRNSKKTPAVTSKFSSENDFENMWESLKQSSPSASSQKQKGRNPTKPTTKSPKPGKPEQTKESVASKRKQEFSLKQAAKTLPKVTNSPVSQPTVKQTTANVKSTASHNRPLDTSRASGSAAASTATAWTVDGVNQPKGAVPATITGTTSASSVQAKNAFLSEVIKNALNVSSPAPSTSSQSAAAPVLVKAAPFSHAGTASGLRPTQPPPVDDLLRTLRLSSPPQAQPSRQISIQELMESCRNRVPAGNSSTEPLLTPESFVVRQSKKSAESRGGAEATSVLQKEGTDTLCDILDIGSQEDKVKEESECGTTWSTASPDNAQNDCDDEEDDANQGDSERDLEVENAKSKKHVSGEKIEDKVRSTSVEKGSADEQGATTGQSKVDQLLRWCQATGVFPPLYTYCDSAQDKGKFHATVQLWNGLSFQSPPYASNEQAMETAASTALGYLERLRHNPANQRTTQQMYPLQSVPPPVMVAPNPYMMAGASPYPMPFPGALPGQPIPPYFVVPPPPMGPAGAPVSGPPTSHTPASVRPSALPPFMANYGQIAPDGSYIIPPQVTHQQRPPAFAPRFAADDSATHPHLYAQAMRPDHPYGYPTSPGRFYAPGPPSQAAYARPMYVLADKTFIPPQVLKQHAQFVSALSPHPQTKATPMTVSSAPSTQYILSDSPAPPEETATTPVKQDGYDAKGLSASAPRLAQSRAPRHIKAAEGASGKRKATLAISFTGPK